MVGDAKLVNDKVSKPGLELAKNYSKWMLSFEFGCLKVQNYLPFRLKLANC